MTVSEALRFLELNPNDNWDTIKEQYRWFVKTYHPDNMETGDIEEYRKAVQAYLCLKDYLEEY